MTALSERKLVLIETSGRIGRVGLAQDDQLLASRQLDEARRHARDLAPSVRELLREQNWRPRDITAVIVSKGPGSYTGLRVGIMSAKAFAYATGCAIVAVDTLAAIALQAGPRSPVDVIADAQQGKVYAQRFAFDSPSVTALNELHVAPFEDWLAVLPANAWVTGSALAIHRAALPAQIQVVEEPLWQPGLESLLQLGLNRLDRGELDNLWPLEPLYHRPSSAEEIWQAKSLGERRSVSAT